MDTTRIASLMHHSYQFATSVYDRCQDASSTPTQPPSAEELELAVQAMFHGKEMQSKLYGTDLLMEDE